MKRSHIVEIVFFVTILAANVFTCLLIHLKICNPESGIIMEAIEMLIAFVINAIWIIGFGTQSGDKSFCEIRVPHKTGKNHRLDALSTFAYMATI